MVDQRTTTLKRLEPSRKSFVLDKTKAWLLRPDTKPLTDEALEVTVGDVRRLWRVRLDISQSKGRTVEGAPELLSQLEDMDSRVRLEQLCFSGAERMGNVFFRKTTREYVGTVFFSDPKLGA